MSSASSSSLHLASSEFIFQLDSSLALTGSSAAESAIPEQAFFNLDDLILLSHEYNSSQVSTTSHGDTVAYTVYLTPDQLMSFLDAYAVHALQLSLQGQPPASQHAIENLYITKGDSSKSCAICLESFHEIDKMIFMPCHHEYHNHCLLKWLENSNTCPHCRYEIETDNDEYNRGVRERMATRQNQHQSVERSNELKRAKSVSQLTLNSQ